RTDACELCGSPVDLRFLCDGRRLYEVGFELMPPTMNAVMERTGWTYDELDLVLCHQAPKPVVARGAEQRGARPHGTPKLGSTVGRCGNTSTVSLPLQLSEAFAAGVLVPGSKILALAGSSGVSMAALTMVW